MLALTRTTGPVLRRLLAVIGIDIGVLAARSIVETRSQSHLLAESLERGIHVDAAVPRTEGADPAMATETYTRLVDDLDGGRAERTVSFSLDGRQFSIDLSKRNIAALEKSLQPYIAAARRGEPAARRGRAAMKGGRSSGSRSDLKAVREWATANGFNVSDRGRISAEVQSAYDAAR